MRNSVAKRLRRQAAQLGVTFPTTYEDVKHRARAYLSFELDEQGKRIEKAYEPLPTKVMTLTCHRSAYQSLKYTYKLLQGTAKAR